MASFSTTFGELFLAEHRNMEWARAEYISDKSTEHLLIPSVPFLDRQDTIPQLLPVYVSCAPSPFTVYLPQCTKPSGSTMHATGVVMRISLHHPGAWWCPRPFCKLQSFGRAFESDSRQMNINMDGPLISKHDEAYKKVCSLIQMKIGCK